MMVIIDGIERYRAHLQQQDNYRIQEVSTVKYRVWATTPTHSSSK
ncbi:hypothetical protein [Escherichia coli]|nr:hypothetical protein [Escherichia coli]